MQKIKFTLLVGLVVLMAAMFVGCDPSVGGAKEPDRYFTLQLLDPETDRVVHTCNLTLSIPNYHYANMLYDPGILEYTSLKYRTSIHRYEPSGDPTTWNTFGTDFFPILVSDYQHCYEFFPELYKYCRGVDESFLKGLQQIGGDSKNTTLDIDAQIQTLCNLFWENEEKKVGKAINTTNGKYKDWAIKPEIKKFFKAFWEESTRRKRLDRLPLKDINECNEKRKAMWKRNKTLPCYACKYYNRSLRITMHNLFGIDTEGEIGRASCRERV